MKTHTYNFKGYYIRICILLFLIISGGSLFQVQAQIKTPMSLRYQTSLHGNMTLIANNVLSQNATANYTGTAGNHNVTTVFVDVDSDPATFNSSKATLSLPSGLNCVTIRKALLYWAAADFEDPGNEPNWQFNQVKFKAPGATSYTTLTADNVIYQGRQEHFQNDPYVCVKDITSLLPSNATGEYTIANVKAKKGDLTGHGGGNIGTSGGWTIVFVYESVSLPQKTINIFDGYVHVYNGMSPNPIPFSFSGFQTIPSGNVSINFLMGALEGDWDLTGDYAEIQKVDASWYNLATGSSLRQTNNIFHSIIGLNGSQFLNRVPASTNTLGFDADIFPITNTGNSVIGNNQTSATIRMGTNQETYGLFLTGLAVDVWEPEISPILTIDGMPGGSGGTVAPGTNLTYSMVIQNKGNDNSKNTKITTVLPLAVDFLNVVTPVPSGVTYNYNSTTRTLTFNIPDNLVEAGDASFTLQYSVKVTDDCARLRNNCSSNSNLIANAIYNGNQAPAQKTTPSSNGLTSCGLGNLLPTTFIISPLPSTCYTPTNLNIKACEIPLQFSSSSDIQNLINNGYIITATDDYLASPITSITSTGTYYAFKVFSQAFPSCYDRIVLTVEIGKPSITINSVINASCFGSTDGSIDISVSGGSPAYSYSWSKNGSPLLANTQDLNGLSFGNYSLTVTDSKGCSVTQSFTITQPNDINIISSVAKTSCAGTADGIITISSISGGTAPYQYKVNAGGFAAANLPLNIGGLSSGNYSITVKDSKGCEKSFSIIVGTIADITPPVINCPPPITVNCSSEVPQPDIALITATDNCSGNIIVSFVGDQISDQSCNNKYTITRTYKAVDAAGNISYCNQIITVNDETAPVISTPTSSLDVTVSCSSEVPAVNLNSISATDNCSGQVTISHVGDVITAGNCANSYTITRTYRATDICGNYSDFVQIITVNDETAPVISTPTSSLDVTVSCSSEVPAVNLNSISATDNCSGQVTISHVGDVITAGNCANSYTITRTYRATDICGNYSDFVQIITVNDETAPVFSELPAESVIYCPAQPQFVTPSVVDNCGGSVELSYNDKRVDGECAGSYSITRIWAAKDLCGNISYASQTIIVKDVTAPVISKLPEPTTINCPAVPEFVKPIATDDCSANVDLTFVDVKTPGECAGSYSITRTWTATDECGNSSTATQTIIVVDTTKPVLVKLSDNLTVNCDGQGNINDLNNWLASNGNAIATDDCGVIRWTNNYNGITSLCGLTGKVTVTFTATDECGNSVSTTSTFSIIDVTPPVIECPENITVNNDEGFNGAYITIPQPVYSEICSSVTLLNDINQTSNASGFYPVGTTTITWTATDECGNISTCTMTVTVLDNEPPAIKCPAPVVSCDESVTLTEPIVTDNSAIQSIVNDAPEVFPTGTTTIVTWTVTDIYGNVSVCHQSVTISKLTATYTVKAQPTCSNAADALISINVNGGNGGYTYSINGGTPQSSNVFTGLSAGVYTVLVNDSIGCSTEVSGIVINDPEPIMVAYSSSQQASCHNSADGYISVTATGGSGSYTYSINGSQPQYSGDFLGLLPGSYIITVFDDKGCQKSTEEIIIENPQELTVTVQSSDQVTCKNDHSGQIVVNAEGGSGNYTYSLNYGAPQTSSTFSNLPAGTYFVIITDKNNCSVITPAIVINNPPAIAVDIEVISPVSCNNSKDASIKINATGGTGNYVYSLDGVNFQQSNIFEGLPAGTYNVTVFDANSCPTTQTIEIENPAPIISTASSPNMADCSGKRGGVAEIFASGGVSPYSYSWSNGSTTSHAGDLSSGTYWVNITDANGCSQKSSVIVESEPKQELVINNAFSPNGDGINDYWVVKNIELYPDNEVVVVNRWGNEIYSQKGYSNTWDGSNLSEGTYYYILKVVMCDEEFTYKGYITILR